MKRFLIILSVLFLLVVMLAGGFALGLFWDKINPFHNQAAEDEQILRWLTQLKQACVIEEPLKGTALRKFEQKTLFGIVAKAEQIPLVEAKARTLLQQQPKLAEKYASELATTGLKVFPIQEQLPRLQVDFAAATGVADDKESRLVVRASRLDSVTIGADGRLTFRGVCLRDKAVSDPILIEAINKRLEANGIVSESLPEVVVEMSHHGHPAPALQKLFAEKQGIHLLAAWYERDGALHLEGLLGKEEQRKPVEAAVAAWLNESAVKPIWQTPGTPKYKVNLVAFDAETQAREFQRNIVEIAQKDKKPHWQRVRVLSIVPTFVIDAGAEAFRFRVAARHLERAGDPPLEAELRTWLETQLPKVVGPDLTPVAPKLAMTSRPSPVEAMQQKLVERNLDGTVFTEARFDADGRLELIGRLARADDKSKQAVANAVSELLATHTPWTLDTLTPHADRDNGAIAWNDVVTACQAKLAEQGGVGRRCRLDRLYFRYVNRQLRLDGAGGFLADTIVENPIDLNSLLDDLIVSREKAAVLPTLFKRIPNPLVAWQKKIADQPTLDGTLLTQLRYGADGTLHIDGWIGTKDKDESLRQLLDANIALLPGVLKPDAKPERLWSIAGMGQHQSLLAKDPTWTELLRSFQGESADDAVLRRTRLDRATFVYRDKPRRLTLQWTATRLKVAQDAPGDPAPAKAIDALAKRYLPKLPLDQVEPTFQLIDTPIYDLQAAAVAQRLDGVLFTDVSFSKDGKLQLDGLRGSDQHPKLLHALVEPMLREKYKGSTTTGIVPLDQLKLVPWQPMFDEIRGQFAADASPFLRQTRIDRIHFEYGDDQKKPKLWITGISVYQGKNPPAEEQPVQWETALKDRFKSRDLAGYELVLDALRRKDNVTFELQRQAIADGMDGVVFRVVGFDAKGALRIHALTPKGEEDNVRRLLDAAAKKHPHLVPIEPVNAPMPLRERPLVPTLRVGTQAQTLRVSNQTDVDAERPDLRSHAERGNEVVALQPMPFEWRKMLVDLQTRFATGSEPILQQTRIDRAYFSLNEADPDQPPFLNIKGICLRTVHDDDKSVAELLRKELNKIAIPGEKYVLKIDEIKIVETPIYALQNEAVVLRQVDPVFNVLFERASYTADGTLVLHVLALDKKLATTALAELHKDQRLLPAETYKTLTLMRRDFDWPGERGKLRDRFAKEIDPLLQRTRFDDLYFAYSADRKKLHLHVSGACVHPPALVAAAERAVRWQSHVNTLIPKVAYEPTTAGITMLPNPSIAWQDDAASLEVHDGILFQLANFDPRGKLKLAIMLPTDPQRAAALKLIAAKPVPAVLEPIDPKNLDFQVWNWKQVIPTAQARLAQGDFVLHRARLDRVLFQYEPTRGDAILHFDGVSLHPIEVEPAEQQRGKLERTFKDLLPVAHEHKRSTARIRFLNSPIYELQTEAVSAKLDGLLFADARYDDAGKLHLKIVAGFPQRRTEAAELVGALKITEGVQRPNGAKPILDISDIAWAEILSQMQGWLARNNDTLMRKTRVERGFFSYPPSKIGPDLNLALLGLYPENDALKARLKRRCADFAQLYITDQLHAGPVAAVPLIEHLDNLALIVQAKVHEVRSLDGVRLDDASFDADGKLIVHGVWAGKRQQTPLETLTRDTLKDAPAALKRGINWDRMQIFDSASLLQTLRGFVADQSDIEEVWLERLYFDKLGAIRVSGFATRERDKEKIYRKLPELIPAFESKKLPAIEGAEPAKKKPEPDARARSIANAVACADAAFVTVHPSPGTPGEGRERLAAFFVLQEKKDDGPIQLDMLKNIAEHLRASVPTSPACDGLRIDRGYYDPQGVFRIDALVDRPGHIGELKPFLDGNAVPFDQKLQLAHDWSGGKITVIPLNPMIVALREALPSLSEFDGFSITRAHHDPDNRLVITGQAIGDADEKEMTPIVKRLLESHPRWRLRTTAGLVIKIAKRDAASADQSKRLVLRALALLQVTIGEAKIEPPWPTPKTAWWSHAWPFDDRLPRVRPTDAEYDRCLEYLDAAILHNPKNNVAWYLRGYCLQAKDRADLTLRDLRRMAEIETDDRDIRHQRILMLELVQGKLRQSAFRIEQQATLDIANGWTLRTLRESPVKIK